MTPAELRRVIATALMKSLGALGFSRKGQFLVRRRCQMATDWLAIVANGRRGGPIDATINVGIHCAPLHHLIAELDGNDYSEIVATFGINIGYLREAHHFHEWAFDRTGANPALLGDVAQCVHEIALPFFEQFVDAASVRRGCERYGINEYNLLRLPVLEAIAGNAAETKVLLSLAFTAVESRDDPAAAYLRDIGHKLRRRLDG